MEIIPNIEQRVVYPKGIPHNWYTLKQFKVRAHERALKNKLPNEFKNALTGYNYRNTDIINWYIDSNDYSCY